METYNCCVFSTAHLTEKDSEILRLDANDSTNFMVLGREPGYFIKLYVSENFDAMSNTQDHYSEYLNRIILDACENGFQLIEFDRDAEIVKGYKTFVW